jgi:uncharacterized DUF497 family protein
LAEFEFGPVEDGVNIAKHGVSWILSVALIENVVGEIADDRRDYGELRRNAFGMVNGRFFVCAYTMRGNAVRIISVRKANRREQRFWLQ